MMLEFQISNWIPASSTFNGVLFTKRQDQEIESYQDEINVAANLEIGVQLYDNDHERDFAAETPRVGDVYRFPYTYDGFFKSLEDNAEYTYKCTSRAVLVERVEGSSEWQTTSYSEGVEVTYASPIVSEKRIYVDTQEDALTTISWVQNKKKYWMSVVSKTHIWSKLDNGSA